MQRSKLLRYTFSIAAVLWTALLLWTQLTPALQTTVLSDDWRGEQSYTLASYAESEDFKEAASVTDSPFVLAATTANSVKQPTLSVSPTPPAATTEQQTVAASAVRQELPVRTTASEQPVVSEYTTVMLPVTTDDSTTRTENTATTQPFVAEPTTISDVQPAVSEVQTNPVSVPLTDVSLPVQTAPTVQDVAANNGVRPLRFGAEVTTHLVSQYDSAAYSLQVVARGAICYTLGYDNSLFSTAGWKLSLYEEYDPTGSSGKTAYRLLHILTSSVATDSVSTGQIGVLPGTYRLVLEVSGTHSDTDVTILAEFTEEVHREAEPNGSATRYNEIYPNTPMYGSSCKFASSLDTDEDWYLFRMEKDGYASYTFTHEPTDMISVGWQIFVYDANLNEIAFANASISEKTVVGENIGLRAGIYFVCIKGRVYTPADYTLTVTAKTAANYECESNDTFADATPISSGTKMTGMLNNRSKGIDYDYFKIVLPKAGSLKLTFTHAVGTDDYDSWNVRLYNEDKESLFADISNRLDTGCVSPLLGVPAGTYYLCIDSDNLYFSNEPYTVQIDYKADRNFEAEPNNTMQTANKLQLGQKISGSLMQYGLLIDKDMFCLSVNELTVVTLTFEHEMSSLDQHTWSVEACDADGNILSPIDLNGYPFTDASGAVLSYLPVYRNQASIGARYILAPGDYYFTVNAGLHFSSETYTLCIE